MQFWEEHIINPINTVVAGIGRKSLRDLTIDYVSQVCHQSSVNHQSVISACDPALVLQDLQSPGSVMRPGELVCVCSTQAFISFPLVLLADTNTP